MSFETESYGRYEIKSGPLAGAWAANAFRKETLVARSAGSTRAEAVAAVKAELDRLDREASSGLDGEGAPSAQIYEAALAELLPSFPDSYIAMLKAHLRAPDQLISATELAKSAGYSGYEGANLHYGKLGQRVAEEIGFVPPKREDGTEIWTCAVARDPALGVDLPDDALLEALTRAIDTQHFQWQLRPQVAEALRSLGL